MLHEEEKNVRLEALLEDLMHGRLVAALRTFYAPEVVIHAPGRPPTRGLEANVQREQRFVDSVAEFLEFSVPAMAAGEDTGMYENILRWRDRDGKTHRLERVAVQKWMDGLIVSERFYHDPAAA